MTKSAENKLDNIEKRLMKLEEAVFGGAEQRPESVEVVDIDTASLNHLRELGSTLDKCLAILDSLFAQDTRHAGLTPDEFADLLRDRFGLRVPLPTISSQLYKATGRYVTRKKIEGPQVKYRYQLLPRGQEYIRKKIAALQGGENDS